MCAAFFSLSLSLSLYLSLSLSLSLSLYLSLFLSLYLSLFLYLSSSSSSSFLVNILSINHSFIQSSFPDTYTHLLITSFILFIHSFIRPLFIHNFIQLSILHFYHHSYSHAIIRLIFYLPIYWMDTFYSEICTADWLRCYIGFYKNTRTIYNIITVHVLT